jgi:hypothetical protein
MTIGYEGLPASYIGKGSPLTPNLGLSLFGMDPVAAENFVLIDTFAAGPFVTIPAGPSGSIQYNKAGIFGGQSSFSLNTTALSVGLPAFSVFGMGANSTPGLINGIVEAGNYPPAAGYGFSAFDISPALITAPPPDHRSLAGLSIGIAAQGIPTENLFAIVTEAASPSAYTGNLQAFFGAYFEVDHNGSGILNNAIGTETDVFNNGSGTITATYGHQVLVFNTGSGIMTSILGASVTCYNQGSGSIGDNNGLYVRTGASSGSITSSDISVVIDSPLTGGTFPALAHEGLRIYDQTAGGVLPNAYAIHVFKGIVDLGVSGVRLGPIAPISWNSDTSISRISATVLGVGNGTQGDFSGTLKASSVILGNGGTAAGTLGIANGGGSGAIITIQNLGATSAYNLNLPTTPGSVGQVLTSQGGGSTSMTWTSVGGSGTVTSVALATGSGASDVLYTISGSPITTNGTITETLNTQTANFVFAGPASGGAATPTFRALVTADLPSGAVVWNAIGNATGALTLANDGNATTFNQTSAVNWTWANTTAATSGTSQSSPIFNINGTYWTGATSAVDSWTIQNIIANGTNGTSKLTFTHSGSTGYSSVVMPKLGIAAAPVSPVMLQITAPTSGAFNTIFQISAANAVSVFNVDEAGDITIQDPLSAAGFNIASSSGLNRLNYVGTNLFSFGKTGDTINTNFVQFARISSTQQNLYVRGVIVPMASGSTTPTIGISRVADGVLGIGNGTLSDITGNLSYNRVNTAGSDYAGQATITAGNTTKAVSFAANYTGTGQPVIVLTPTSDPLALGVPVGYWVTYSGGAGAWTGFTVNIQTSLSGNVTFNYIVIGVA